jgi:3-oxoacyl-[acyl-carrier protein] reductase
MNIFLTGGSRGIGLAIKNKFESEKHKVFAPTKLELNLLDFNAINKYSETFTENIDVLINNAGVNNISNLEDLDIFNIANTLQVNAIGPLLLIKNLSKNMIKNKKGHIINISSILSYIPKKGRITYSASKAALDSITRTCALELKEHNIQVNSICPGYVETELTYKNNSPEQIEEIKNSMAIKRLLKPEEIAEEVYKLALNKNATGQIISVDGGLSSAN